MTNELTTLPAPSTLQDWHALLSQIFTFHPLGLTLIDQTYQPDEVVFDGLFYYLAGRQDELRWQIAAACNMYSRYHRKDAYELAAEVMDLQAHTVAIWASVERNVPLEVRRPEVSIWFHQLVATLPPARQTECLAYCIANGLSHTRFEYWLNNRQGIPTPQVEYRSDKLYQVEQENYELLNENLDLKEQLKIQTSKLSPDPDGPTLTRAICHAIDQLAAIYPPGVEAVKRHIDNLGGY